MLKLQTPNGDTRILLHSCCAPCSSAIIECMLANGLRPTVFYCNPNIYPQAEYETRKNEAIRFVTAQGLDFVDADYDYAHWKAQMTGLEDEPERGPRCLRCFTLRLTETARYASEHGFTPPATPAPCSGNRTGGKADYRSGATSCSANMHSTTNSTAAANSA